MIGPWARPVVPRHVYGRIAEDDQLPDREFRSHHRPRRGRTHERQSVDLTHGDEGRSDLPPLDASPPRSPVRRRDTYFEITGTLDGETPDTCGRPADEEGVPHHERAIQVRPPQQLRPLRAVSGERRTILLRFVMLALIRGHDEQSTMRVLEIAGPQPPGRHPGSASLFRSEHSAEHGWKTAWTSRHRPIVRGAARGSGACTRHPCRDRPERILVQEPRSRAHFFVAREAARATFRTAPARPPRRHPSGHPSGHLSWHLPPESLARTGIRCHHEQTHQGGVDTCGRHQRLIATTGVNSGFCHSSSTHPREGRAQPAASAFRRNHTRRS